MNEQQVHVGLVEKKTTSKIIGSHQGYEGQDSDHTLEIKNEIKQITETVICVLQQEEMSEQQVRVGLVEKKLETATKDSEEKVQAVQRKLEEAQNQLVKKEK